MKDNVWFFLLGDSSVPDNLKTSSSILKGKISFMKQLKKWLGEKCKWNLCYRASRDGWSSQDFHSRCDNKGPTVVLVKANDCIFGGYADQNWAGICEILLTHLSFFRITNLRIFAFLECIHTRSDLYWILHVFAFCSCIGSHENL